MSRPKWFKYDWVWQKDNCTGFLNAKKRPLIEHEQILVFSSDSIAYFPQDLIACEKQNRRHGNSKNYGSQTVRGGLQEFTNYPKSVLKFAKDRDKLHPTQKPVSLFEYLIKTYTYPGATVLDPFAGSGTTGEACRNSDRKAILIEQELEYCEKIVKRLAQGNLNPLV